MKKRKFKLIFLILIFIFSLSACGQAGPQGPQGEQGIQGETGPEGQPGKDGHSPVIAIGDNGNWFVDGIDTGVTAKGEQGEDGYTPKITIQDGYWYIDGVNTDVSAEGLKGEQGGSISKVEFNDLGQLVITLSDGTVLEPIDLPKQDEHSHSFTDWDFLKEPTCEDKGIEFRFCEDCNYTESRYVDLLEHTYVDGYCSVCNFQHPNFKNYEGKVISILGDSISTFAGYIPTADGFNLEHLSRYPQDNLLTDVNETWWMQVINEFDAKLGVNDSWRGSTVSGGASVTSGTTGEKAAMSNLTRIQNLGSNGTPDVIIFYGGTNDLAHISEVGNFSLENAPNVVDLNTTKWDNLVDGYVNTLLRLKYYYPNSEIVCLLPTYTKSYYTDTKLANCNEILSEVCEYYGIKYIDLRYCGISVNNLPDGIHPDSIGMEYISKSIINLLIDDCDISCGENIVHQISSNLINVTSSLGHYKGISNNLPYETIIDGDIIDIEVTMDGIDITSECYSNNIISISNVSGDIVINITGREKAIYEDYIIDDLDNICSSTNIWEITEFSEKYYDGQDWIIHSSNQVCSITLPISEGDQIWANSFLEKSINGGSINGIRVTWFDKTSVIKSLSANETYEEVVLNGFLTAPAGATAVNIPWWSIDNQNEVYILNKEHNYSEGSCLLCGASDTSLINLDGKVISIMSASTSTFAGFIPTADGFNLEHRARYPQDNLFNYVGHTWWMQLIKGSNAKLGINESWAGSTISNISDINSGDIGPDAAMASITRIKNLGSNGTPDLILFYGGNNDITKNYTIGTFDSSTAPISVDLETEKWDTVVDAFVCAVLRIKYFYPNAELVIMLPHHTNNTTTNNKKDLLNAELIKVCEYYDINYVDLRLLTEYKNHLLDGSHPDEIGMDMITNLVSTELIKQISFNEEENIVYPIVHNLTNGKAELHYYKGISKGRVFEEKVEGNDVLVLMGGIDITNEVYNNGIIYIEEVTGKLEITVIDNFDADGHLQILPNDITSKTNIWTTLVPENIYFTANGWGLISSSSSVHSVTFDVEEGDRIFATSFGASPANGFTANGTRITWFGETGVLKSVDRYTVYDEFINNGYITVPKGAIAVNIPMASNKPEFEIYILNR